MQPDYQLIQGDVLEGIPLPDESVHCCVTSPPYWGLRDYGTGQWEGGAEGCDHVMPRNINRINPGDKSSTNVGSLVNTWQVCAKCGAVRVDSQLGLETTPEEYIERMVQVFREVRRVLRRDGTLFLNLGDSYASSGEKSNNNGTGKSTMGWPGQRAETLNKAAGMKLPASNHGLKPKDLCMIPARVALALQQPYEPPHKIKLERDRAWLAAFLDGEGCLSIRRYHGVSSHPSLRPTQDGFVPFLCATNNDVPLLDYCHQITGEGRVALKDRPRVDDRGIHSRRDSYGWRVESKAAVDIVVDVYPYLIAKRKQAVLIYNLALSNMQGRELRGNGPLPKEEQDKRELLKRLVNACNQREEIDIPSWCVEPKRIIEPGWWLRSVIIWSKPNPMPESVTDRPTTAHEYIYLLSKSADYFYDADAIREKTGNEATWEEYANSDGRRHFHEHDAERGMMQYNPAFKSMTNPAGRNKRTVWTVPTAPYPGAHFATFPPKLIEPCILAGTSARGACSICGSPWERVTDRVTEFASGSGRAGNVPNGKHAGAPQALSGAYDIRMGPVVRSETTGWQPTCKHHDAPLVPCTVLDPFAGSGTTLSVALRHGRRAVGMELNPEYIRLAEKRVAETQPALFALEEAT